VTLIADLGKCTRSLVPSAGKRMKYRLNRMAADQLIVRTVTRNADREDFSR